MGTLASLMDLARQSLMANQAALNVVSNNVANQNTPGYTREVANFETRDSVVIGGVTVGGGVSVGQSGTSQRDRVLEQRIQQQTQALAHSSALSSALQQVETIFGLTSDSSATGSTQLGAALNTFFGALSTLSGSPADSVIRQQVLAAAASLSGAFNTAASELAQVTNGLDTQVRDNLGKINSLTATVASLNQKIASSHPDDDAGVLEDQRQQAILELSQYVGVSQIPTENNGITLTTSGGSVLVSGSHSYAVQAVFVSGQTRVYAGAVPHDVTQEISGGSLGGLLEARDNQMPSFQTAIDELAYAIGTEVNNINAQGLDASGNPGQALFALPSTAVGAAGLIQVATNDPQSIAAASIGEGASGNSNALLLAGLQQTGIVSGQPPIAFLSSFIAQIGNAAAAAKGDAAVQQTNVSDLTTQRNALSGVSLDEEATNLTNYQRSYEAAAKVFSIVDQMMATALNLGVPTSVS